MNLLSNDVRSFPLAGSIQNSVGMGFLGNQATIAVANALGVRVVHAASAFAGAHGGVQGRQTTVADLAQFRRDVQFVIAQRPAIVHLGYLPKPGHVDAVATALCDFKGIVLLDPVIGDFKKGLFVSEETARAIRDVLLPLAQIVTPNRFEAEVLLGAAADTMSEHAFLNAIFDLGPSAVAITSFERDPAKHRTTSLFSNGYSYNRISSPYFPGFPAYGAGDVFAGSVATLVALGGSPFAAIVLATALASRAVASTTTYGGGTVDPVAALAKWSPAGHQADDDAAIRFAARSNVESTAIAGMRGDTSRLQFAPPKSTIVYG